MAQQARHYTFPNGAPLAQRRTPVWPFLPKPEARGILPSMQTVDAAALIRKLEDFALGTDPSAMSDAQVEAGLGLLRHALPDLTEIEVRVTEDRRSKGFSVATTNTPLVGG